MSPELNEVTQCQTESQKDTQSQIESHRVTQSLMESQKVMQSQLSYINPTKSHRIIKSHAKRCTNQNNNLVHHIVSLTIVVTAIFHEKFVWYGASPPV